jgi:AraC-like DNA-binding protein
MQIKPHPALAHLVRHYLILDGLQPVGGIHRLFADGNTGMVFNLGNAALSTIGNSLTTNSCWLYGQVKTFHDISLTGNINWIVVVLQPYGASHLWGVPATEWINCFFPAAEVLHARIQDVCHALMKAKQLNEQVQMLDNFLQQEMNKCKAPDPIIVQAVKQIEEYQGLVSVESLLQTLFVSERTLERKFNQAIGISPKRFIDIVRLNISAKRLQQMKEKRGLTGIAYDSGYFDQAHFTKEFKKITGVTPQQYHDHVRPLALNFLQL